MTLFRFKTFRTSYFFPSYTKERSVLYGLYSPFGGKIAVNFIWWAFKYFTPFRWMMRCNNPDKYFPYSRIKSFCPLDSTLSFNLGTPGEEQKISILGIDKEGNHFFAKYSVKPKARELSKNEIQVLQTLEGTGIAPTLLDTNISNNAIFFRTSCVEGKNPSNVTINTNIWTLLDTLSKLHLPTIHNNGGLITCLSHGDFTPWNMIVENGKYRLIDWEMAEERPVGYDILTYITQLPLLLEPQKSLRSVISENNNSLVRYFKSFGIDDFQPYIKAFAIEKFHNKEANGQHTEALKYKELIP